MRGWLVLEGIAPSGKGWLSGWWSSRKSSSLPRQGHLETKVGGLELSSDIDLSDNGYFELQVQEKFSPVRRGWRVARNQLFLNGENQANGCALLLNLPDKTNSALLVILPSSFTCGKHPPDLHSHDLPLERINRALQRLCRTPGEHRPVLYLGCMPVGNENREREVALALTALGWPNGILTLLPSLPGQEDAILLHGMKSLRWLVAGKLEMVVVNLQPALADSLLEMANPEEGQANITQILDTQTLCFDPSGKPSQEIPSGNLDFTRPTRASHVTRAPIVFCHGMLGVSTLRMQTVENLNSFSSLKPFLEDRGFRVFFPQVPPTSGVVERANHLKKQILNWTDRPVNLIAHSMGGLDCRFMISHLDMAKNVQSLTTIATPHHGSYLADWFIANYKKRVPLLLAMQAIGINIDGFSDCTLEACRQFNEITPDQPNVSYFSYGAEVPQSRIYPFLRRAWSILTPVEGPNDGIVSSKSAHWGQYLGMIPVDHFAQTPDGTLVHPAETFDALGFYLHLTDDLAWRGF